MQNLEDILLFIAYLKYEDMEKAKEAVDAFKKETGCPNCGSSEHKYDVFSQKVICIECYHIIKDLKEPLNDTN